ncbi:MAG TPA: vitamin K epoxide reductase family protein [Pyrinomonadaceae bacterium]|jgi:uncharacterized membrane protein
MSSTENIFNPFKKFAMAAAIVAVGGIIDAVYLTIHHYTARPVPCSILEGCEMVLTSQYATMAGIPLALYGAIAYFIAFALAILTVLGKRKTWLLFSLQVTVMSIFTVWLLYVQGVVLEAFCQFCLISALVTFTLFIIALVSRFRRSN